MEQLIHLIYTSAASGLPDQGDLEEILRVSRENNGRRSVTGMLLYSEGTFFQVLEGAPSVVDDTFALIARDVRHRTVVTIIRERIAARAFPTWTMGLVTATSQEIARVVGMNDALDQRSSLDDLNPGRARKLVAAFLSGRWRATGEVSLAAAGGR